MCGIWASAGLKVSRQAITMASHRGPDGQGWIELPSTAGPVLLGHTLLGITGKGDCVQPVSSPCASAWLTYNGEIYNQSVIRNRLKSAGHSIYGAADTWSVFGALQLWDRGAAGQFEGMFALVYFDAVKKRLLAVRDRFGIKPLYMLRQGNGIAFASEIKQFLGIDGFRPRLNTQRASDFLEIGVTDHSRQTMWRDVVSVPAGGCVEVTIEDGGSITVHESLWYRLPLSTKTSPGPNHSIEEFRTRLHEAVSEHAQVNVPAAISLSGGLDSSTVACLVPKPLPCYSISYNDPSIDEIEFARVITSHRNSELVPVRIEPDELESLAAEACWQLDEPYPSLTIVAQCAVFRAARRDGIKVMLTGQGADELLGGYPFLRGANLIGLLRKGHVRRLLSEARELNRSTSDPGSALRAAATAVLPPGWLPWLTRNGLAEPALARARLAVHRGGGRDRAGAGLGAFRPALLGPANLAMLLRYEDRTSMANSIEARPPFLDRSVVEAALGFDETALIRRGLNKFPLRSAMTDVVPPAVLNRRDKKGFPTPESQWLRGPLRSFVQRGARSAQERFPHLISRQQIDGIGDVLQESGPLRLPIWRIAVLGGWAERFNISD